MYEQRKKSKGEVHRITNIDARRSKKKLDLYEPLENRQQLGDREKKDYIDQFDYQLKLRGFFKNSRDLKLVDEKAVLDSISTNKISNEVPLIAARVLPDNPITRSSGTLGHPNANDVFITAADDIKELNAKQIAERLTIPESPTGFIIIEFITPISGIASPINRDDPGFIGGGQTRGEAREFVIPNGVIPANFKTRIVK